MPEAIIFTGVQASGKTTYFSDFFLGTHVRISLDLLKTRNREKRFFDLCIDSQMSFVVDNTNPTRIDRERYLVQLKNSGFTIVGYYFKSSIVECLARNKLRTGKAKIPDIGVLSTHKKLEKPERSEGYDKLWYASILENGKFQVEEWSDEF